MVWSGPASATGRALRAAKGHGEEGAGLAGQRDHQSIALPQPTGRICGTVLLSSASLTTNRPLSRIAPLVTRVARLSPLPTVSVQSGTRRGSSKERTSHWGGAGATDELLRAKHRLRFGGERGQAKQQEKTGAQNRQYPKQHLATVTRILFPLSAQKKPNPDVTLTQSPRQMVE